MNTDNDFLIAINTSPEDDILKLAYVDWLYERGDPRAGAWLALVDSIEYKLFKDEEKVVPEVVR